MTDMNMSAERSEAERRNHMIASQRKDQFVEWIKGMLYHSFVLGNKTESYQQTMLYIEELIEEHRQKTESGETGGRLKTLVPSIGYFHTAVPLKAAFDMYNDKYMVTARQHVAPTFHEIRHMLNLAQLMAINKNLKFVSFDGDQTLYSDGGNFAENSGLSFQIIELIKAGIMVCVITAANYQHEGDKYEVRLEGLLRRFVKAGLKAEEIERFHIMGGECNYLLQCKLVEQASERNPDVMVKRARIMPVPHENWQADHFDAPKPSTWPKDKVTAFLDAAEASFKKSKEEMRLRTRVIRKVTSVGMIPGGDKMVGEVPSGHGSSKIKEEALNEVVLRAMEVIHGLPKDLLELPYTAFNGGRDCWVDVGTKGVAVEALQAYFRVPKGGCLHVGDQFLKTGNDISARSACPCIWITSPKETFKILDYVLRFSLDMDKVDQAAAAAKADDLAAEMAISPGNSPRKGDSDNKFSFPPPAPKMDIYTGEMLNK
jgi:IMP and pyridine-specific 5'-nucleotidase